MNELQDFLEQPSDILQPSGQPYDPFQWGHSIASQAESEDAFESADIILLGCGLMNGIGQMPAMTTKAPDLIRQCFYSLYRWHESIRIFDAGNIKQGADISDTRAALRTVLTELEKSGKTVILLGGSHDLTIQQYEAFKKQEKVIQVCVADMLIDLEEKEITDPSNFLLGMLTEQPNFIRHYCHLGFQSYYTQPRILETLDKLRFDFYRVGKLREYMDEAEPVLRGCQLFSFDITAIKHADAPANYQGSPNGFTGEDACMLSRFAGMSPELSSWGIYGFEPHFDQDQMTAKQIAQMLWYFIDGFYLRKQEASIHQEDAFLRFHLTIAEEPVSFIKSKKTNRWWMEMADKQYIPCTYQDYLTAARNEIPERWMRVHERLV